VASEERAYGGGQRTGHGHVEAGHGVIVPVCTPLFLPSRPSLILSSGRALRELSAPGPCSATEDKIARLCRRPQAHGALVGQADARQAAVLCGYAVRAGGVGGRAKLDGAVFLVEAAATDPDAVHGKEPRRGLWWWAIDIHRLAMKLICRLCLHTHKKKRRGHCSQLVLSIPSHLAAVVASRREYVKCRHS
jgi:hypothetical protein